MVGIIVALEKEASSFLEKFQQKKELFACGKKLYLGKVCDKDVVLIISGVGKVNATLSTQYIIDMYNPRFLINFGTAGGMSNNVEILNYYLIKNCSQFDFDLSALDGVPVGYIQDYDCVLFETYDSGISMKTSNCASGDRFNDDPNDVSTILSMSCHVRDMECGAIAQVCKTNNKKLVVIKGITDVYGNKTAAEQFLENLKKVSNGFAEIIPNIIKNII